MLLDSRCHEADKLSPARATGLRGAFWTGQVGIALLFVAILAENYNANLQPRLQLAVIPTLPVVSASLPSVQLA